MSAASRRCNSRARNVVTSPSVVVPRAHRPAPALIFVNRFFHPDHSATSQMLSDLAFHLARAGRTVRIITSRGRYDDPTADLPAYERIDGVDIHRVCRPRFGRASIGRRALDALDMHRRFAHALARLGAPGDGVIIKTDPPLLSVALAPVTRARRMVQINWLQDLYPEVALGLGVGVARPFAPLLSALRNASLKSAASNVTIGVLMAERLAQAGVAHERIALIANWCDDAAIRPCFHANNPLRRAWGLEGKFVVGYSGNLGRAHEIDTILGAAELLSAHEDIVFLFIGGGHLEGPLKAQIAARGLGARFQFRPYQEAEALPHSLALPDAHWLSLAPAMEGLIVPSKFYGIAAAGRPTLAVTAADGEIARLVRAHACGAQVTPGDARALADIILALRADPARVASMGAAARALIEREFSRAQAFAAWTQLVDRVCARKQ